MSKGVLAHTFIWETYVLQKFEDLHKAWSVVKWIVLKVESEVEFTDVLNTLFVKGFVSFASCLVHALLSLMR